MSGVGSNPFICFRWSKCAGEVYGRGPLINALSSIKTTNLTIQLILENAQMSISGIYQMEDDGVINPDTINLVPGTIIPKAMGSAGLQPIQALIYFLSLKEIGLFNLCVDFILIL